MMKTGEIMRDRLKNNKGFTLIEVITVLVILAIVGAVVLARGLSTSTYSVKSQAEAFKSHIRYAQSRAMATDDRWGINVTDNKHYSLFRDNGTTMTTVILPGADSNPVVLKTDEPLLSTGTVRFNEKGSPVDASGNLLVAVAGDAEGVVATFTVSMGGETETIKIRQNTGFIE